MKYGQYGKEILKEGGVNVLIKNMRKVTIHQVTVVNHECAGGVLPPDRAEHRSVVLVEMKDGTAYEVLRETVDRDGKFSTESAREVTREVRVKGEA